MGNGFIKAVPSVMAKDGGITGNKAVCQTILFNKPGEDVRNGHYKVLFAFSRLNGGGEALAKNPIC